MKNYTLLWHTGGCSDIIDWEGHSQRTAGKLDIEKTMKTELSI